MLAGYAEARSKRLAALRAQYAAPVAAGRGGGEGREGGGLARPAAGRRNPDAPPRGAPLRRGGGAGASPVFSFPEQHAVPWHSTHWSETSSSSFRACARWRGRRPRRLFLPSGD